MSTPEFEVTTVFALVTGLVVLGGAKRAGQPSQLSRAADLVDAAGPFHANVDVLKVDQVKLPAGRIACPPWAAALGP
jgi:hypothetical protein